MGKKTFRSGPNKELSGYIASYIAILLGIAGCSFIIVAGADDPSLPMIIFGVSFLIIALIPMIGLLPQKNAVSAPKRVGFFEGIRDYFRTKEPPKKEKKIWKRKKHKFNSQPWGTPNFEKPNDE